MRYSDMSIEASYNFRNVDDEVTTSGSVGADSLKALAEQGYEVVVNLLPDSSQYAVSGEREIVESQGLEYIHIPVDFEKPTRSDFEQFSQTMDRLRGKKIHVHCAANFRVTAFYSLHEVRRARWSVNQAMAFIHGVWNPAEHAGWSEFMAVILDGAEQSPQPDRREDAAPDQR
ncbi:MAG TPA: protein tyrosine phosphatase family protein [Steroidobacteraceae bacterium]|nr:protein tyrosine phosphatase family protein [Steroidobacteraceae bacterium]